MPRLPKESLPNCKGCRLVKDFIKKASKNFEKHIIIYAIFYVLLMELTSLFLVEQSNYLYFWYPLLNTFGYLLIFSSLLYSAKRLRFCLLKKFSIISLIFIYLFSIIALLFQINETVYTNYINNSFTIIGIVSLVLSLLKSEK